MLWFAPRKPRTGWSRPNKERVERMLREGLMHPAGLAKGEQAKADGSWTSLDAIEDLQVPPDLEWIQASRKAETRAARVMETARLADRNQRANQWRRKGTS